MNQVLQLLLEGERLSTAQMAKVLHLSQEEIDKALAELEGQNILLGWRPVLNPAYAAEGHVRAVIEVKITPERGGGFSRLAERIAKFEEVESCYLMSGAYDLLVFVRGKNLHNVAMFVSGRLATVEGVLSTATHFVLEAYKEQGFYLGEGASQPDKPAVSP